MSIYDAIANSGANAGAGIQNYFATKHQLGREREADQMVRDQNALAMQDRQFQYKQKILSQAALVKAGGGDWVGYIKGEGARYGINDPVDETQLGPMLDQMVASNQGEKFALTPTYFEGPDGNLIVTQLRQGGGMSIIDTPEGYRPVPSNIMRSDVGNAIVYRDPRTGSIIGSEPKGVPPQDTPEARGAAQEAVQEVTSSFDKRSAFPKVRNSIKTEKDKTEMIEGKIAEALAIIEKNKNRIIPSTGAGAFMRFLPATDARTLNNIFETIKGNIAFGELQTMRQNSPTGGALGSISDRENTRLESLQGSLDQAMDADVLVRNLLDVQRQRRQAYNNLESAFMQDFGDFIDVKVNNAVTNPQSDGWEDAGNGVRIREKR